MASYKKTSTVRLLSMSPTYRKRHFFHRARKKYLAISDPRLLALAPSASHRASARVRFPLHAVSRPSLCTAALELQQLSDWVRNSSLGVSHDATRCPRCPQRKHRPPSPLPPLLLPPPPFPTPPPLPSAPSFPPPPALPFLRLTFFYPAPSALASSSPAT